MEITVLQRAGLTKSEVAVYTTLLKLGASKTGSILKHANISSGKIYEVLDKLIEKGLVSFEIKNKVKHFQAANPEKLLEYVEQKKKELEQTEEDVTSLLPNLKKLQQSTKEEYSTKIFEGFEGLKAVTFNTLEGKGEWLAMGVSTKRSPKFNRMWERWHSLRERKNIPARIIITTNSSKEYLKGTNAELRLLEAVTPSPISIFQNTILIYDWVKESVIVIENERIAQSFRTFFESLWTSAKE